MTHSPDRPYRQAEIYIGTHVQMVKVAPALRIRDTIEEQVIGRFVAVGVRSSDPIVAGIAPVSAYRTGQRKEDTLSIGACPLYPLTPLYVYGVHWHFRTSSVIS